MIDADIILPLNFFKYGGTYTGQNGNMRYMIKPVGEKPDLKLLASVWRGPYASAAVAEENITSSEFEFSQDGRLAAINWLSEQYELRLEYWLAAPSILEAKLPE